MSKEDIFGNLMGYSSSSVQPSTSTMKKSEKLLLDIGTRGFNMAQLGKVIQAEGNQLIISCAGSGKTTAVIFKIIYDVVTGEVTKVVEVNGNPVRVLEKIWVCTFLKSGSDELKSKLSLWQTQLGVMNTADSIKFSTLHAEFKRALTSLGRSTNIVDSKTNSQNLKKILNNLSVQYEGKALNSDMIRNVEGALTYTRNRLDAKRYERDIYADLGIGPTIIDSILFEWKRMRFDLGCVDFEDLQEILYDECYTKNNEDVIAYLSNRYAYVYVDEFQDTSQIQYQLLKVYAQGAKKVVVIGDDDQTIYSWRGSYNKIITEEFSKDFNPTISELSVNYRCPSTILNSIIPSIEKNEDRFTKEFKASKEGGVLRVGEYSNYKQMVDSLGAMVQQDVSDGYSVAVLCRVNSDGLMPALFFDNLREFKFSISGDGMTLDSYIGRSVVNIAKLFTERATPAVKSALGSLVYNKYNINNLMRVCKNNRVSFWEVPAEDLAYSCPEIAEDLKTWKMWRREYGDLTALRLVYMYFRTNVYARESQYNDVCRSVILSVETLLESFNGTCIEDFIEEIENINERLKARKLKQKGCRVKISTVHEFKGKEADSVYIWNDSVDVFPHKNSLSSKEEFEEERRVHYIACTRARKRSTLLCMKDKRGNFVDEMNLSQAEELAPVMKGTLGPKTIEDSSAEEIVKELSEILI